MFQNYENMLNKDGRQLDDLITSDKLVADTKKFLTDG